MMPSQETTFEEDLEALDEVVSDLEGGELGLDEALRRFEQGVALARRLRSRLDVAESRIEELLADGSTRALDVQ